jgi:hypothetical protein
MWRLGRVNWFQESFKEQRRDKGVSRRGENAKKATTPNPTPFRASIKHVIIIHSCYVHPILSLLPSFHQDPSGKGPVGVSLG